jgi:hypothetical protein
MREPLGKLGRILAGKFLPAAMLFLLLSPALCHAEPSCFLLQPVINSITPSTWHAGKTYDNVVLIGDFPYGDCATPLVYVAIAPFNPSAPDIDLDSLVTVSNVQITS